MTGAAVVISQLCLLRWFLSDKCAQTGLSSGHSPCVWEISYTAFYRRPQTRFPSRGAEVAVDYSSRKSVALAARMSWHFAGGQEPVCYNSLETLASASFPAWNRPQGEVKSAVPVLPCCSQEYFLQNWQANLARSSIAQGLWNSSSAERKKVTYPLINWALKYGACKEALAASLNVVLEVWQMVESCAQINLNGLKARSKEEKHPRRWRRKNPPALSDQSLMLFLLSPQLSIPIMHRLHLQWLTGIRT